MQAEREKQIEENPKNLKTGLKIFMETFQQSQVSVYSVLSTYYLLLSFFPLLIALGNILPLLNFDKQTVMVYIQELLPVAIYDIMDETINDLLNTSSGGLLSISAIGTFWAMSKGINGIRLSLDQAYNVGKEKFQLSRRLFSFLMVFILIVGMISLMLIMGFGQTILEYVLPTLGLPEDILGTFRTLKWPVTAIMLFIILLILYYFIPNAKVHFRTILPGSLFTTISWMGVTQFYGVYITHFSKSISSYGVIGGFIFFILWLNVVATLIIIGGVINVTFEKYFYGEIRHKSSPFGEYIKKQVAAKKEE